MTPQKALKAFAWFLPLIFGLAFLAPVIDQAMKAMGIAAPFGLSTLALGLIVGGAWGVFAQITGRWI